MAATASFEIRPAVDGGRVLALAGDWTAAGLGRTGARLRAAATGGAQPLDVDISALGRVDTAGALALIDGAGVSADRLRAERPDAARLLELVAAGRPDPVPAPRRGRGCSAS